MKVYLTLAAIIAAAVLLAAYRGREDRPRILAVCPDGTAILEDGTVTKPGYVNWRDFNGE